MGEDAWLGGMFICWLVWLSHPLSRRDGIVGVGCWDLFPPWGYIVAILLWESSEFWYGEPAAETGVGSEES